jgi:hypothetical protein
LLKSEAVAFMPYEFVGFNICPSFEPIASSLMMFVGLRIMNDGMNTNRLGYSVYVYIFDLYSPVLNPIRLGLVHSLTQSNMIQPFHDGPETTELSPSTESPLGWGAKNRFPSSIPYARLLRCGMTSSAMQCCHSCESCLEFVGVLGRHFDLRRR